MAMWFHGNGNEQPDELRALAGHYGLAIECGALKMLGCPIGRDRQRVEHLLLAQVDKHRQ